MRQFFGAPTYVSSETACSERQQQHTHTYTYACVWRANPSKIKWRNFRQRIEHWREKSKPSRWPQKTQSVPSVKNSLLASNESIIGGALGASLHAKHLRAGLWPRVGRSCGGIHVPRSLITAVGSQWFQTFFSLGCNALFQALGKGRNNHSYLHSAYLLRLDSA